MLRRCAEPTEELCVCVSFSRLVFCLLMTHVLRPLALFLHLPHSLALWSPLILSFTPLSLPSVSALLSRSAADACLNNWPWRPVTSCQCKSNLLQLFVVLISLSPSSVQSCPGIIWKWAGLPRVHDPPPLLSCGSFCLLVSFFLVPSVL